MEKLDSVQRVLLDLLAMELHQKEISPPEKVDWNQVLNESLMQAVPVIAYNSARKLNIPGEVLENWRKISKLTVFNNMRVDREHGELHDMLSAAGIPYVTLKGSTSASYYPSPVIRAMGDVDFLIDRKNVDTVDFLLKAKGFIPAESKHECEIAYHRDTTTWELHWQVNGVPGGAVGKQVQAYLDDLISEARWMENDYGGFMAASPFHHGLIMLVHVARHMVTGGIGLRHLCDWSVYVSQIGEDFPPLFRDKLRRVGLWRFAQLLTQLSVAYLGCPEQNWVGEIGPDILSDLILDVFAGGNFGQKNPQRRDASRFLTSRDKGGVNDDSVAKQSLLSANEIVRRHWPAAKKCPLLYPAGWVFFGGRYLVRMIGGKREKIPVKDLLEDAGGRRVLYRQLKLYEEEQHGES